MAGRAGHGYPSHVAPKARALTTLVAAIIVRTAACDGAERAGGACAIDADHTAMVQVGVQLHGGPATATPPGARRGSGDSGNHDEYVDVESISVVRPFLDTPVLARVHRARPSASDAPVLAQVHRDRPTARTKAGKNASQPRPVATARRPGGAPKAKPSGSRPAAHHAPNETAKLSEEMGWRLPAPLIDLVSYSPNVSRPGNWLYGHKTTNCDARGDLRWDNKPETLLSRVLLPLWFCAILLAICRMGFASREQALQAATDSASESIGVHQHRNHERRWHLDYARIVCMACVVTEHSGGSTYTKHNVGFVLQWILPFFWLTSGACFMMSSVSMQAYIGRLSLLLLVGVGANWIADLSTGRDWQRNFGDTIFQMFYVVALMVLSVICEPLRRALKWRKTSQNPPPGYMILGSTFLWCSLTLLGFAYFIRGKDMVELNAKNKSWFYYKQDVVRHFSLIMIQVCGMLFLSLIATLIGSSEKLGWYLLAMVFLPRVIIPWNQVGFAHNVELFILAMVLEGFPLKGHKQIANWFGSYWPIVFAFLLLVSCPDMVGRCDLMPPETYWERTRFYGTELILVTLFVTGSFKMSDPWKCTGWLYCWALYAYCFHVFWARLVPEPYGAVITYGHLAVFYALSKFCPRYFRSADTVEDESTPPKKTCKT